ncbi:MAG: UDP-3-O-[3-hydroxymyristoyl] N-acetylglucosamine deacetylase [Thermodesulfobacteriota bacterium]|nr:UDP-3-O-[3-hydroxymyristoyl] N-acetylglucosamine deacetylase [Thermodesulfobacteriota bacterium]
MKKGRILVVDDQEQILESLNAILSDESHEVICARDGQEALHIVQSDAPDLVFLDIWIPGIDGLQTLKAIKRIDPNCAVVMMSGHGTIETAVKAIKLGATDYLEKPLNLEDVLHLVDKAIAGRSRSNKNRESLAGFPGSIIGESPMATGLTAALEDAAACNQNIWFVGEKGTGKEFLARLLHHMEGKDRDSLIKLRCRDLTGENIDDVMQAYKTRLTQGRHKRVDSGTFLLVRVDKLDGSLQDQFAQSISSLNSIDKAWTDRTGRMKLRIVCTSVLEPKELTERHDFPAVLADALGQKIIRVPSLRDRAEDIPLLVQHFLQEAVSEFDRNLEGADDEAMRCLRSYSWPGNIKELKILMEHVVMTAAGPLIQMHDLLIPKNGDSELTDAEEDMSSDGSVVAEELKSVVRVSEIPGLRGITDTTVESLSRSTYQKTLRGRVVMYGQGLHSGIKTGLTISPMPPSTGIVFGQITSGGTVPALISHVESTGFSTSLKRNGSLARTIEHLMAVFHVYGLTNLLVKISGEVPIMDGSALDFCDLVENAEIITQDEPIEPIKITEVFELPQEAGSTKSLRVEPSDCLEVDYYLEYPPPVGVMRKVFRCETPIVFKNEIAPARTFGFVKDMRMMDEMGLAGGGRLSNVILMDDEKVINPPLRFTDEFVRHKILDIIGDFYLLGRPFIGKIVARLTGHTENIAMLKIISEKLGIM